MSSLLQADPCAFTDIFGFSVQALGTYFTVYYGEVQFRRYQMGQGYAALIILLGLFIDYGVAQMLQANDSTTMREEILRFLLSSFGLSLFLCTYYAHYNYRYINYSREHHRSIREMALLEEQPLPEPDCLVAGDHCLTEAQTDPDDRESPHGCAISVEASSSDASNTDEPRQSIRVSRLIGNGGLEGGDAGIGSLSYGVTRIHLEAGHTPIPDTLNQRQFGNSEEFSIGTTKITSIRYIYLRASKNSNLNSYIIGKK